MHDYSAQALDAPVAESWVDCKENRQCMAANGPPSGYVDFFQTSPHHSSSMIHHNLEKCTKNFAAPTQHILPRRRPGKPPVPQKAAISLKN